MSKCISHNGEFGEHDHDSAGDHRFICKRCWVLDEDAVLAALDTAQAELADANKRIEERDTYGEEYHRCYCERGYDHVSDL